MMKLFKRDTPKEDDWKQELNFVLAEIKKRIEDVFSFYIEYKPSRNFLGLRRWSRMPGVVSALQDMGVEVIRFHNGGNPYYYIRFKDSTVSEMLSLEMSYISASEAAELSGVTKNPLHPETLENRNADIDLYQALIKIKSVAGMGHKLTYFLRMSPVAVQKLKELGYAVKQIEGDKDHPPQIMVSWGSESPIPSSS